MFAAAALACALLTSAAAHAAPAVVPPRPLQQVDAVYPLDEAPAAFAHAARPGALKVLLRPAL